MAPILVIFDDESISYGCFCKLMERMIENFPNGDDAMDMHFANMRYAVEEDICSVVNLSPLICCLEILPGR